MKKTLLAGIRLNISEEEFHAQMSETESLCRACGLDVVSHVTQRSRSMDPNTAFRQGKLEELKVTAEETEAELIVFHNALSIQMTERISAYCGCNVIDRTAVILDIFAERARTAQAKLQVELARLQYDLPRQLNESADSSGHERGGGAYNRGAGEMRSRLVARKYAAQTARLKKELEKVQQQKYRDERRRTRTMMRRAALCGYTNAGKSSLMNVLIRDSGSPGQSVYEEDMLFATLDTSVRMIRAGSRSFLLYDTVGFVSSLPPTLIEAFQATLDAARDADLIVHVIDASDPQMDRKIQITEDTLREIGAGDIEILRVYNKCDLIREEDRPQGLCISCTANEGIQQLKQALADHLYPPQQTVDVYMPYDKMGMVNEYRAVLLVQEIRSDDEGTVLRISGPARYTEAFRNFRIRKEEV